MIASTAVVGAVVASGARPASAGAIEILPPGDDYVFRSRTAYNVKDYLPHYSSDSAAIQAAINDASLNKGGEVYLPRGAYSIGTSLVVKPLVTLRGEGAGTVLSINGSIAAITFAAATIGSVTYSGGYRSRVTSLQIEGASSTTTTCGIDFSQAGDTITVDHIIFGRNVRTGLKITPSVSGAGKYFIDCIRWDQSGCQTGIILGDGTNLVTDIRMSRLLGTGGPDSQDWMIVHNNVDTLDVQGLFYVGTRGVTIGDVSGAGSVTGAKFSELVVDNMTGINIVNCRDLQMNCCAVQACGAAGSSGLNFGSQSQGVRMQGGIIQGNAGDGIGIQSGARHIDISNVHITDNNKLNLAFRYGVSVVGGASEWAVRDCRIGNYLQSSAGFQKGGVFVAAGNSDYYMVTGNRFVGLAAQALVDGGTGTRKVISGNLAG